MTGSNSSGQTLAEQRRQIDWYKFTIYFILLVGTAIRLIQYLGRSSYWKDELFSIINIEKMSMWELITQQPEYNQVAGVGFYIIQKCLVLLFGDSNELVTRFYPFLASVLSLWIFYLIARKFLKGTQLAAALILLTCSIASLGQSFQAKPYSGDIFFTMFFVLSILSIKENSLRKWQYWGVGAVGMAGAMASLPAAVFALAAILLVLWKRSRKIRIQELLPVLIPWGLGALANIWYANFVISTEVSEAMFGFWSNAFPPSDSIIGFLKFYPVSVWESIISFLTFGPLANILGSFMLLLSFFGFLFLYQKDRFLLFVLILPLIMALALATFYIYPYHQRTTYYASWPFFIFPFMGLSYLQQMIKWWKPRVSNTVAIIIIVLPVFVIANFIPYLPYEIEPVKKPLQIIADNMQSGDQIYIHIKGDLYLEYYGPKTGVTDYVLGSRESLESAEHYAKELEQFLGEARVWYYYVGARPETDSKVSSAEIRDILDRQGQKIEEFDYQEGLYETFLVLYDFAGE